MLLTGVFATTSVNPAGADGLLYGNPGQMIPQIVAILATAGLAAAGTAIILFTASWSGPDRMLIAILDEVAKEYPSVSLRKIDIDESPELAEVCEIHSIPTLVTFKAGTRGPNLVGTLPKDKIEQLFESFQ